MISATALALFVALQVAPPIMPAPMVEARAGSLEFTQPRINVEGSQAPYTADFWVVVSNRGATPDRVVEIEAPGSVEGPIMVYVRDRQEALIPQDDPLLIPPSGPTAAIVVVRASLAGLGDAERYSNGVPIRLRFERSGWVDVVARPPRPVIRPQRNPASKP
ncbi:hypothetical protein [Brevundimonas sp. M20]|uniref:hypothetical protein n=1 Tax=Brevundimonas sp. M20 TaxID=2591463 RepID=UPI0011479FAA|nr:hypothetical protein [Brevundimonas sp. M20]QDH74839.1 hypothetical protein FKQ52_16290 [Brevundimonas sp. M20]